VNAISKPPGEPSRRSFFLFLMLAPAGFLIIFAIVMVAQFRQFKASVSPVPDVKVVSFDTPACELLEDVARRCLFFVKGNASSGWKMDSLWLNSDDLNVLLAASPTASAQGMRFHVSIDSVVTVRSTQPVQALQGKFAWMFKLMAKSGYLNARLEGRPEFKDGKLTFMPDRGFLNGQKVPAIALQKRGGMSPEDFMTNREFYADFLQAVSSVEVTQGRILVIRNR
jgi:hypothetical protein